MCQIPYPVMSLILSLADMSATRLLKPCIHDNVLLESYLKQRPAILHCPIPFLSRPLLIHKSGVGKRYAEKDSQRPG